MKQRPLQLHYARPMKKEPKPFEMGGGNYTGMGWLAWFVALVLNFAACANFSDGMLGVAACALVFSFVSAMREVTGGVHGSSTHCLLVADVVLGLYMFGVHSFMNFDWCC
jgi:hypothetical protein